MYIGKVFPWQISAIVMTHRYLNGHFPCQLWVTWHKWKGLNWDHITQGGQGQLGRHICGMILLTASLTNCQQKQCSSFRFNRETMGLFIRYLICHVCHNCNYKGTAHFKQCEKLFGYQHLLLLRDIWWSKLETIFKCN